MPYDPRQMQQMGRMGLGMLGQPQATPFERPKEWWEQPLPARKDQPADQSADPSQSPQDDPSKVYPKPPPSLLDMMMGLGRLTRPEYDKAIQGPGSYGVAPKEAARLGPWAFLGSLGGGGYGSR